MKPSSDEQVRAYFLGKLSAAQAEIFEEKHSANAELIEQAQMVERELTDDYLRGNLSAEDIRLFESNYLVTEARRGKLLVAEGLWKIANEKPQRAAAPNPFWQTFFGGRKVLPLAFGGVILLLIFAAAFYLLTPGVNKNDVAEINVTNPPAKIENPVIQNHETENQNTTATATNSAVQDRETEKNLNSAPKHQTEPKTVPTPKINGQTQTGLAIFTLLPGTLRAEGEQFINVLPNTKNISLTLKLPEDAGKYQIYRAVLKPVEGDTIYTSPNLKSLNFTISAEKFENRTYLIFLEGRNAQNEFESVAEYSFRVRR